MNYQNYWISSVLLSIPTSGHFSSLNLGNKEGHFMFPYHTRCRKIVSRDVFVQNVLSKKGKYLSTSSIQGHLSPKPDTIEKTSFWGIVTKKS